MTTPAPDIRSRIVRHGEEAPDQLLANPANFRRHPGEQLDALRGSMRTLGWIKTVVVNVTTGHVLDGHARIEEALRQELPTIPVTYVELTEAEERIALAVLDPISELAYRDDDAIALAVLDPISELAYRDDDAVAELLKSIETDDPGLRALFTQMATDAKIELGSNVQPDADVDAVPDTPPTPITQLGDLIILGRHRLLCGDATVAANLDRLMNGVKADIVFTDPPYGVDIQELDMEQARVRGRRKDGLGIANDDLKGQDLFEFLLAAFRQAIAQTKPGACWYVCCPSGVDYRHPLNALESLEIARHGIVWIKDRFVMGRCDYHYRHENIIYGWTPGAAHRAVPTRDQDTVWEFPRPGRSPEHPTMKPVALIQRALQNSSILGDIVLEPFAGSGSTLMAAEITGRSACCVEISPAYCDVVCTRFERATGIAAIRPNHVRK